MAKNRKKKSLKMGKNSLDYRELRKLKSNNPNVIKERYVDKQKRLREEEESRLDLATVRKGQFGWEKSDSFIEGDFEVIENKYERSSQY